jgi:O-antigen ligase
MSKKPNLHWMLSPALVVITVGGAVAQMTGWPLTGIAVCFFSTLILYSTYSVKTSQTIRKWAWLIIITFLLGWTIVSATDIARSSLGVLNISIALLVYFTLCDLNARVTDSSATTWKLSLPNMFKTALLLVAFVHASVLLVGYIMFPDMRWTGLFSDYSQAAIFILFSYGLAAPFIRDKPYGVGLTFLLFLGFFCTFSRTANFLLAVFAVFFVYFEVQNKRLNNAVKFCATLIFALALVYLYPLLVDFNAVDRNSLNEIRTLNSRTIYWQAAFESIMAHPFWGIGLGNYEYSGIKALRPFHLISSVHNDYLQVGVELGLLWALAFLFGAAYLVLRYQPFHFHGKLRFSLKETDENKQTAWLLLLCFCLYMLINFIVGFFIFQLILAILLYELREHDECKDS